ncbi:MAG: peptidase S41, partial [Chitinophagaceae bacterium]
MTKLLWGLVLMAMASCSVSKPFSPSKKFSPKELEEDYTIFRSTLEESHPSLYWYTAKDSMDYYF